MATVRWPDERIQDLADEVRVLRLLPQEVGKQAVRLDNHDRIIEHLDRTLSSLDEKLDANNAAFRITPGMRLAATVPIITSLVACVGVILASKGGN